MQTLKLKYKCDDEGMSVIKQCQRQYTSCFNVYYNRLLYGYSKSEVEKLELNNIELLDSWFKRCCSYDAAGLLSSRKTLQFTLSKKHENMNQQQIDKCKRIFEKRKLHPIFGSSKQFFKRQNNKISNEEFKKARLHPIYSIGENSISSVKGNRKFQIQSDLNTIIFKPNRKTEITLNLQGIGNRLSILKTLYLKQESSVNKIKIHYKLDQEYIYISFEETDIKNVHTPKIKNRVLGIDLNPNYIGWSIVDWKSENEFKIIKSGVYSLKTINDSIENVTNKRIYEVQKISQHIINTAIHYQCELCSIEDLSIRPSDQKKGKKLNKLNNNKWLRTTFVQNITKRCNIFNIKLLKVKAEYSSAVGNILFRHLNLPDMVLASFEIGRRGYEFYNQYIIKSKDTKKNIICPDINLFYMYYIKSLEEFNICQQSVEGLIDLYYVLKNSKVKYRVPLNIKHLKSLRVFPKQSGIFVI